MTPPRWESVPLWERALQTRELTRACRLTRGIGHRVNSTPDGNRHAEGGDGSRRIGAGWEATASTSGHDCLGTQREGQTCPRAKLSLQETEQRFGEGTEKTGNSQVVSYLCRGDPLSVTGPPSRWTDTYLAGRRYASESRSRAARPGRPATPCFQLLPGGPRVSRARRPGICARVWEPRPGCPGTCPHTCAPACARRSGGRARSVLAFRESIRMRRARSSPGLPGAGASGREEKRRLLFPSLFLRTGRPRGDLTLGPTSHSQEQRSAGPK